MKLQVRSLARVAATTAGVILGLGALEVVTPKVARAFTLLGGGDLSGGFRWDADLRFVNGRERSLDGGLRYSLEGGSYEAYRDLFSWNVLPTVDDFQMAVEGAFAAWTAIDPVTGLGTDLFFVADFDTEVVGRAAGGGVSSAGAEIDLLASINGESWNPGDNTRRGEAGVAGVRGSAVTLTSGTENYQGQGAISGADITLNNNAGAVYDLNIFRRLLTHEIGHALGLGDLELNLNGGTFIDDNYDGSTNATAAATLTNSFAALIDPLDPSNSPLGEFNVANGTPGIDSPGVDLLMESQGLGIGATNPVDNLFPLTNDEYAGRQFLYPFIAAATEPGPSTSVPEPSALLGLSVAIGAGALLRKRQRKTA